jgi:hypothetical protein
VRTKLFPVPFHEIGESGNGDEQVHRDHWVLLRERPMYFLSDSKHVIRTHKRAE